MVKLMFLQNDDSRKTLITAERLTVLTISISGTFFLNGCIPLFFLILYVELLSKEYLNQTHIHNMYVCTVEPVLNLS